MTKFKLINQFLLIILTIIAYLKVNHIC